MVVFPNCKINIGLNITGKRTDGYHDLQTIFYPLPIRDALEIIENKNSDDDVIFTNSGHDIVDVTGENICVKAYRILKKDYPALPPVKMHLHKNIPIGAGLGGGSADGAFVLELMNEKFELNLSDGQLLSYALQLGSDCPFFIINQPCFATGRGENLQPILLDLSAFEVLVINPGIHVSTAKAFALLPQPKEPMPLKLLVTQPISTWKTVITNDFEMPVFQLHPEIGMLKELLYKAGAVYASMSGSGSTVYGIFHRGERPAFNLPPQYFFCWV